MKNIPVCGISSEGDSQTKTIEDKILINEKCIIIQDMQTKKHNVFQN